MNLHNIIILFILFCGHNSVSQCYGYELEVSVEYALERNLKFLIYFSAQTIQDNILIYKYLNNANIRASVIACGGHTLGKPQMDVSHGNSFYDKVGLVIEEGCDNEYLMKSHNMFTSLNKWLIFSNDVDSLSINNLYHPYSSDVLIFERYVLIQNDIKIQMFNKYVPFRTDLKKRMVKIESLEKYMDFNDIQIKGNRVKKELLKEITLNVTTNLKHLKNSEDPFAYLTTETIKYRDSNAKLSFSLILLIQHIYGFQIHLCTKRRMSLQSGIHNNKMGDPLRLTKPPYTGHTELQAYSMMMHSELLSVADVLFQIYEKKSGFTLRGSGVGSINAFLTKPFAPSTWVVYFLVGVISALCFWMFTIFEYQLLGKFQQRSQENSLLYEAMVVLSSTCQIGIPVYPRTWFRRLAYVTFFLCALLMYNYYTSKIVSSLLNTQQEIWSIRQLANSRYKCGSLWSEYYALNYNLTDNSDIEYLKQRKFTDTPYVDAEKGVNLIRDESYALYSEYIRIYPLIERLFLPSEICELIQIDSHPTSHNALWTSKRSEFLEIFKVGSSLIRETGHLSRQSRRLIPQPPRCASRSYAHVGLEHVAGAYVALALAYVLALLVLAAETLHERRHIRKLEIVFPFKKVTVFRLESMEKQFNSLVEHFTYPYSNCCIFVDLKLGSTIIAVLITFLSFCTFAISTQATKDALEQRHIPYFYVLVMILLALSTCIYSVASVVLLYAVLREKIDFIEYWVYASMIGFIVFTSLAVAGFIDHSARHKNFKIALLINEVFVLGTLTYFILVIKSYKIMLVVELEDAEDEAGLEAGQENVKPRSKELSSGLKDAEDKADLEVGQQNDKSPSEELNLDIMNEIDENENHKQ